ncbi:MAG: prolipoprotein diacylglyceryl transferase [Chloroflexi bacterium]|nr:prolipoprotein diacylglyceryl transferase [Chloroflexota bacterium]
MIEAIQNWFAPPRHLILLVIALWFGWWLAERIVKREGKVHEAAFSNLTFYGLLAFVIGGRVLYALDNLAVFSLSPLSIFSPNPQLFDPFFAGTAAIVTMLVYGQRAKLPFWQTLDALTPLLAALMLGLGAAHLAEGSAFGRETSLPWGIAVDGVTRHPSQVYETVFAFFILNLIGTRGPLPHAGAQFLTFLAWTSAARLFLEAFRGDSVLIFGSLRLGQILAWAVLAVAFLALNRLQSKEQLAN